MTDNKREEREEEFNIAAKIALYNNVIAQAQAALAILQDDNSSEDELSIDVFLEGAKAIVKEIATAYNVESIMEQIAEDDEE